MTGLTAMQAAPLLVVAAGVVAIAVMMVAPEPSFAAADTLRLPVYAPDWQPAEEMPAPEPAPPVDANARTLQLPKLAPPDWQLDDTQPFEPVPRDEWTPPEYLAGHRVEYGGTPAAPPLEPVDLAAYQPRHAAPGELEVRR